MEASGNEKDKVTQKINTNEEVFWKSSRAEKLSRVPPRTQGLGIMEEALAMVQ